MTAPSFTYSGNVYTGAAAGTVDFALTSTTGNAIAYLEPSHIHVYKSSNQGVTWTELTRPSQWNFVTNGTVARLATGIAAGDWVKVQRITPSTSSYVTFQASSLLTAEQLNDDTLFNTYLNQERVDQGDQSTVTANSAVATAASAVTTANSAVTTANSAVTTANNAVATANSASATAASAVTTANSAVSTANSAVTTAGNAVSTANAATATAGNAVTTANSAVSTANAATATANSAVSTANTASSNASAALNAVAGSLQYVLVANVAAIPASPPNNYAIEVADSTGVESFSPLANRPAGFVGDVGLSVRMQYSTTGPTWNWLNYFSNNPETRYLKLSGGTLTGQLRADDSTSVAAPVIAFDGDTNTGIAHTGADELALVTGGTARLTIDPSGNVAVSGGLTKGGNSVVTTGDTGSVTSTMIADGAIVNADVNASAAIAGTKINPDFGSQSITTTGTATAASLIPSSSTVPTNGVYLPSANTVGISTNSVGRVFVDASGNVGLGTNFPQQGLHVHNSGSTSSRIRITNSTTTDAAGKGLQFTQSGVTSFITNNEAGDLAFATSATERMRLDSSGRLGVGTSSVASTLHIVDSSFAGNGTIRLGGGGAFTGFYSTIYQDSQSNGKLLFNSVAGSGSVHGHQFQVDGTAAVTIDASRRVGIGTSSPGAIIHTVANVSGGNPSTSGTTDPNVIARFQGGSINLDAGVLTSGSIWLQPRLLSNFATNFSLLLCPNGGNVGIGNTGPSARLDVGNIGGNVTGGDFRVDTTNGSATVTVGRASSTGGDHTNFLVTDRTGYMRFLVDARNDVIRFGRSSVESARFDDAGRFLVGTSTTSNNVWLNESLAVVRAGNGYGGATFTQYSGTTQAHSSMLTFQRSRGTTDGSLTSVASGDALGWFGFKGADGSSFVEAARIECFVDGTPGTNDMPGRLVFSVTRDGQASPEERMRISQGGNIRMFAAANNAGLALALTDNSASGQDGITLAHSATGITGSGTVSFRVIANGNVTNTNNSYGAISDAKLKENIVDATSQWNDLKALQVRKYNLKEGQTHTQIGLVAQEVELVSPGLVTESPDRDAEGNDLGTVTKSVNYSVLYMKAVKALQEAMERIETLEAKVAALESA